MYVSNHFTIYHHQETELPTILKRNGEKRSLCHCYGLTDQQIIQLLLVADAHAVNNKCKCRYSFFHTKLGFFFASTKLSLRHYPKPD